MSFLVEITLPEGLEPLYFITDAFSRPYNGREYIGAGALLDIKFPDEDATLEVHPATVTLDGLDVAMVSMALSEPLEYCPVLISCLMHNPDTRQDISAFRIIRGTMSNIKIIPPSSAGSD
jgi:hypothetical protein